MNEFELQGLEREIEAWRRRLSSQDAPIIRAELNDIARDVEGLRIHAVTPEEPQARQSVELRLCRLRSLYDGEPGSRNGRRGSA